MERDSDLDLEKGVWGGHCRPASMTVRHIAEIGSRSSESRARLRDFRGMVWRLIVECDTSAALDLQYARKRRGTVREV
jgi:hypothetical protein